MLHSAPRRRPRWVRLAAVTLFGAMYAPAQGWAQERDVPFSTCAAVPRARSLDSLRRPGISALRCAVAPGTTLLILSDDTKSWPVIRSGRRSVSLEDPVGLRQWIANASALRVRDDQDGYRVVGGSRRDPRFLVYSSVASATDGGRDIPVYVAVRLRPDSCVVAVGANRAAVEAKANARAPCLPKVEAGRG